MSKLAKTKNKMDYDKILQSGIDMGIDFDHIHRKMLSAYIAESKVQGNLLRNNILTKSPISDDYFNDMQKRLLKKYFQELIDHDKMLSKKQVKEADTIDLSALVDESTLQSYLPPYKFSDEENEYMNTHPYCFVPPLVQGALKVNKGVYFIFDVIDLNVDEKEYKLYLEGYRMDRGVWMLNNATIVNLKWENGTVQFIDEYFHSLSKLFETISPFNFDFTEDEELFWRKVILPSIMVLDDREEKENKAHPLNYFLWAVIHTNMELSKNKLHTIRGSKGKAAKAIGEQSEEPKKKQFIRNIGDTGISIKSEKIPREATYERIIRYKIAAWNTRGHERHLKSGKVVYVKPSVHHRRCLKDSTNQDPAQTMIKID